MSTSPDNEIGLDRENLPPPRVSLKVNAISNWAMLGVNIAVGLLLTPFAISHLGKTSYGIWRLVVSFVGYYGLLNLGVGSAITRYIARYSGQGDLKSLNKTASTAMTMLSCTATLVVVASFLLAEPAARFFDVAPEHFSDFKRVVWILGLSAALGFFRSLFQTIVIAHERFVPTNIASIAVVLIRAGLVVLMLGLGKGLLGVAYATLISGAVAVLLQFLIYKSYAPRVRMHFTAARWSVFRMLLVYGGVTTVIVAADIIRTHLNSFVIGKWIGLPQVGVYAIAAMLCGFMIRLIIAGMSVLTPRFASLDGAGEKLRLQRLFLKSLSISGFLAFGMSTLAIIFGGRFIILWISHDFAADAIPVLWIIATAYAFALSQNPGIGLMRALYKHHFYAVATMIEAAMNLSLSIWLAPKYGIIGVALGTAIPMLLIKTLVMPIYVSRIAGVSILDYVRRLITPAILAILMVYVSYLLGVLEFLNTCSLISLIAYGILTGLMFAGLVLIISPLIGVPLVVRKRR